MGTLCAREISSRWECTPTRSTRCVKAVESLSSAAASTAWPKLAKPTPDLAVIAACAPSAAICLISALSYHGITTQIPSSVHLAVPRGSYHGIKLSIPVSVHQFSKKTFNEGLETQRIGGMPLRIYSAARTVVDCFKFRNKLGLDVALEALRLARQRNRVQNRELLPYARLLRVERAMTPYLQAVE